MAALVRLPVLQQIALKTALINEVDVVLADPGHGNLEHVQQQIHIAIQVDAPKVLIRSAIARMERIRLAQ